MALIALPFLSNAHSVHLHFMVFTWGRLRMGTCESCVRWGTRYTGMFLLALAMHYMSCRCSAYNGELEFLG